VKSKKYVFLFLIYFITIILTVYFFMIYRNSIVNVDDSSIDHIITDVTGNTYEMLYDNISNYNKEDHDYIIYVASYKYYDLSDFERNLSEVVIDNSLKNIIYINVDELKKYEYLNRLISDFSDSQYPDVKIGELPVFIYFKNEKIVDIVNVRNKDKYSLINLLGVKYD